MVMSAANSKKLGQRKNVENVLWTPVLLDALRDAIREGSMGLPSFVVEKQSLPRVARALGRHPATSDLISVSDASLASQLQLLIEKYGGDADGFLKFEADLNKNMSTISTGVSVTVQHRSTPPKTAQVSKPSAKRVAPVQSSNSVPSKVAAGSRAASSVDLGRESTNALAKKRKIAALGTSTRLDSESEKDFPLVSAADLGDDGEAVYRPF